MTALQHLEEKMPASPPCGGAGVAQLREQQEEAELLDVAIAENLTVLGYDE